ncbi:hypothetical protein Natpe_0983 [Natrinema pellirubrum DSM 15624]|uniref:Uncharacterized protein n=1 Tax=Natrinema pellirubrum (strain DSM 15624 / CIP 106293 / JCM 10476 / NCIMB 786 / 157) TaxID=797303 RepID=L0JHA1_NATP1|nr:hypothetical protein Natpe_0983 [Natrinema pellirubrum DSM 15624]
MRGYTAPTIRIEPNALLSTALADIDREARTVITVYVAPSRDITLTSVPDRTRQPLLAAGGKRGGHRSDPHLLLVPALDAGLFGEAL